jgi:shikimate dehydrogenase
MHSAAYAAAGLDLDYIAIQCEPDDFPAALERLSSQGCQGVNVTVPNKFAAYEWAQSHGGLAGEDVGAAPTVSVNTICLDSGAGISTDEPGFMASLRAFGILRKKKTLLLGAGGSAQALALRLLKDEWPLTVWNRTSSKWDDFCDQRGVDIPILDQPDPTDFELIINATSTGLTQTSLGIEWSKADPSAHVVDLAYGERLPVLLAEARTAGLKVHDGRQMLMEQGALSFEWWLDIAAPRADMLKAIS